MSAKITVFVISVEAILHLLLYKKHHIETSQLICSANQLTGFYLMETSAFNELTHFSPILYSIPPENRKAKVS